LKEHISLRKSAPVFETQPIGVDAGSFYCNSAIEIETNLQPLDLLDLLESMEKDFGRSTKGDRSPRLLDLDIVFYEQHVMSSTRLTLPHPSCWYRQFVLDPVCEIAPDYFHPVKQASVSHLRDRLLLKPFCLGIAGGRNDEIQTLYDSLQTSFPQIEINLIDTIAKEQIERQTIIAWLGTRENSTPSFAFEDLPLISRLDLSEVDQNPLEFMEEVLKSALDL